jgi:hypothetical protein
MLDVMRGEGWCISRLRVREGLSRVLVDRAHRLADVLVVSTLVCCLSQGWRKEDH